MSVYKGTLKYSDLSGGFWSLQVDNKSYHLVGDIPLDGFSDGSYVSVEADEIESMGIGMVGSMLSLTSIVKV